MLTPMNMINRRLFDRDSARNFLIPAAVPAGRPPRLPRDEFPPSDGGLFM